MPKDFEGLYLVEEETDFNTKQSSVHLFSRLKNGEKKIETIKDYIPYFFVEKNCPVNNNEAKYTTIYGDKVKRVICDNSKDKWERKKDIESKGYKHYEADIPLTSRFLIDEVEDIIPSKYKLFYMDIETTSTGGFPDVNTTQQPIICLTNYNSMDKKYICWMWRDDFGTTKEQNEENEVEIRKFETEKDMLIDYMNYCKIENVDVMIAWNGVHFDFRYLLNRMKNIHDINIREFSPIGSAYVTDDKPGLQAGHTFQGHAYIKGIVLFDLLQYYRKVCKGELSSYALNNVGKEELGLEKTDSHHVVDNDWRNEYMNVIKYNKRDVEIMVKVDEKRGVFDFFDQMRTISHNNIDDCKFYGRVVDTFILRYAKEKGIILPSKKEYDPNRKLEGGFVMDPKVGLHKNMIVIDLNAIYPNLINSFNLSPECRCDDGEIDINGIKFTKKFKGIIPSVLDELQRLRGLYKGKMKELRYDDPEFKIYDAKQQASKNLACTIYGIQALSTYRLNTDFIAQTITYLGRTLINWVKDETKKRGFETYYQDTDSCFIKLPDEWSKEKCIEESKKLAEDLNNHMDDFTKPYNVTEHSLGLDFEKYYTKLLLVAKKRYVGWMTWKDGDDDDALQVTGLDMKRSDTSQISKQLQKDMFNVLLKEDNVPKIKEIIEAAIIHIKNSDYENIAIPIKFENNLDDYKTNIPRVRAAKYTNQKLGLNYGAGDKILMLYTKGESDCFAFEDNKQAKEILENNPLEIDHAVMLEKLVFMKIRRILESTGLTDMELQLNTKYVKGNEDLSRYF